MLIGLILFEEILGGFPFNAPISVPKILSAAVMLSILRGQFDRKLLEIRFLKSDVFGLPIVFRSFLAKRARVYSLFVYFILL